MKRSTLGVLVLAALPTAAAFGCFLPREHACGADGDCAAGNVCLAGSCSPRPCTSDDACGASTDCETHACVAGTCKTTPVRAGPLPAQRQTEGDCEVLRCDGHGKLETAADPTDTPADDGNPCTDEICGPNGPAHPDSPLEQACASAGNAGVCDGAGACVQCVADADCTAGAEPRCETAAHACVSCDNGVQDTDEVGIDCGGACPLKCPLESCTTDAECSTGHCGSGQCRLINNQPCTGNAQCLSFHCTGPTGAKTCQACNWQTSPCSSGVCNGGLCSSP